MTNKPDQHEQGFKVITAKHGRSYILKVTENGDGKVVKAVIGPATFVRSFDDDDDMCNPQQLDGQISRM